MIIAISGASNSGKTTFIEELKDIYKNKCVIFNEIIRDIVSESIDDLRKDKNKYFLVQNAIISLKILQENTIKDKNKLYIFDRSLADSYYYFEKYVDKNIEGYKYFLNIIYKNLKNSINNIYNYIFLFSPLENIEESKYRPSNLKNIQYKEFESIKKITYDVCLDHNKIYNINIIKNKKKIYTILNKEVELWK